MLDTFFFTVSNKKSGIINCQIKVKIIISLQFTKTAEKKPSY